MKADLATFGVATWNWALAMSGWKHVCMLDAGAHVYSGVAFLLMPNPLLSCTYHSGIFASC